MHHSVHMIRNEFCVPGAAGFPALAAYKIAATLAPLHVVQTARSVGAADTIVRVGPEGVVEPVVGANLVQALGELEVLGGVQRRGDRASNS